MRTSYSNEVDARAAWHALREKLGFDKFMEMTSSGFIQTGITAGVFWIEIEEPPTDPMPSFPALYQFIRDYYLHSRFEGRGVDYANIVATAHYSDLLREGRGAIGHYESRTGKIIKFNRALEITNADAPPIQIQKRAGNFTHIYGQAM